MRNSSSLGIVVKSGRAERVMCQELPHIRCNWCVNLCVRIYTLGVYMCVWHGMTPFVQRAGAKDGAKVWRANWPPYFQTLMGSANLEALWVLMSVAFSARLADLPEKRKEAEKKVKKSRDRGILASHLGTFFGTGYIFTLCSHPPSQKKKRKKKRNQCWKKRWSKWSAWEV